MSSRRLFLSAVIAGGAGIVLSANAEAQTVQPSPSASPPSKPPSEVALATAKEMRRYDSKLTDADIANIAGQIDDNNKAGAKLNPASKRLKNSDEPVTTLRVAR